jgi:hypothetical protein
MNLGRVTVITPPDKFFNLDISYLLVKPTQSVLENFHAILGQSEEDINVFIYDTDEADIEWLLSVAHQVAVIIIDVDNCDSITKSFVAFMLTHPHAYYITTDELTPYHLITKNRIFDLDWIVEQIKNDEDIDDNTTE